ncbi:MAG: hypothetical protein ACYSR0_13125, partial [Planctomycetota bacterium]
WEWHIVDDGSDEPYDGYIDAVLEDMSIKYEKRNTLDRRVYAVDTSVIYLYEIEHQGHPAPVRNFPMDRLTGDLVCFRDDDGYWDKMFLEKMSKPFLTKDTIMTYCYRNITRFRGLYDFKRIYDNTPNFPDKHGANYNPQYEGDGNFKAGADTGDVMLRTDVFNEVSGFGSPDETHGQEDLFLWWAIFARYPGAKVIEIGEVLNYYIWHQASIPNRTIPK